MKGINTGAQSCHCHFQKKIGMKKGEVSQKTQLVIIEKKREE